MIPVRQFLNLIKRKQTSLGNFFKVSTCPCLANPKAPITIGKVKSPQLCPTFYEFHLATDDTILSTLNVLKVGGITALLILLIPRGVVLSITTDMPICSYSNHPDIVVTDKLYM